MQRSRYIYTSGNVFLKYLKMKTRELKKTVVLYEPRHKFAEIACSQYSREKRSISPVANWKSLSADGKNEATRTITVA